jgi:hypothetical protein
MESRCIVGEIMDGVSYCSGFDGFWGGAEEEVLLRRMIIPEKGGYVIAETFPALKRLKENGVVPCGLTNNFICVFRVC